MKRFDASLDAKPLKKKILDAADRRFRVYGFKKTTMAEIADDVGMSTANLYRYFPSKVDIAESFALRCFEEKEKSLAVIVNNNTLSAEQRLSAFALELLHHNYQQLIEVPTINDIIAALCESSSLLVNRKRQGEADLLTEILKIGAEQDHWQFDDAKQASQTLLASWTLFTTPTFLRTYQKEELENLVNEMLSFLLLGLKARN